MWLSIQIFPNFMRKTIAMLVTVGINYYGGLHPQYVPYLLQVVVRTIEAALQNDASIHSTWLNLCESYEETIQVDVEASKSLLHSGPVDPFSGGPGPRWIDLLEPRIVQLR